MRQKLLISLAALALGAGGFVMMFGAAIGQESDTPAVFSAIGRSYLSGKLAVAIQPGKDRWVVRDLAAIDVIMQARGWVYTDRMGGMIVYGQGSERLGVSCGQFSRFYMICELGEGWRVP
jgi:hypothetical protein